jgi:hypothetical protein
MSDSPRFIEGKVYRYERIASYTFPARGSSGTRTPDTLFVYSRDPETGSGVFDELIEPDNPCGLDGRSEGRRGPPRQRLDLPADLETGRRLG